MMQNRKTATKLLLVQWSRFQHVCIELEGSTLFTGVNGSGKSTVLDAMCGGIRKVMVQRGISVSDRSSVILQWNSGHRQSRNIW